MSNKEAHLSTWSVTTLSRLDVASSCAYGDWELSRIACGTAGVVFRKWCQQKLLECGRVATAEDSLGKCAAGCTRQDS